MIVSIVVAMTEEGVIGVNNTLPWHLPADLKRFKAITLGHPVIMGRKTFDSIGKALPGRRNIIISRNRDLQIAGAEVTGDLYEALDLCRVGAASEVFVIGGAQIFESALPLSHRLYVTWVHKKIRGDVTFPAWSKADFEAFNEGSCDDPIPFTYVRYDRLPRSSRRLDI